MIYTPVLSGPGPSFTHKERWSGMKPRLMLLLVAASILAGVLADLPWGT